MKRLSGKGVIRLMREEYSSHLKGILSEVEVFDSRGKMIIGQDLKVIHKPSGYEYTVDSVKGSNGEAKVTLRTPETPRPSTQDVKNVVPKDVKKDLEKAEKEKFEFPEVEIESEDPEKDGEEAEDKVDRGIKAYPKNVEPPSEEQVFVVDQKDFERDYEEA